MSGYVTILLFVAVAALSPLLSALVGRAMRIPLVVFEIVLGIVLGPSLLGWIRPGDATEFMSNIGLAALFFLAGSEIDVAGLGARALGRSGLVWLGSLVVASVAGFLLLHSWSSGILIGIALTTTTLGALLPILRDAGELDTPFGKAVAAVGAVGEFGPLVAISIFLSGRSPLTSGLVLLGFVIVAIGAILVARFAPLTPLHRLMVRSLHTSGQFAVRFVVLILAALAALSVVLGLDMLLGAFTAGLLGRLLLRAAPEEARLNVEEKIEGLGYGFFVPFFFVNTGVTLSMSALLGSPWHLALVPIILGLLLVLRGVPASLVAPRGSSRRDRAALALFGATGLSIIVAIAQIGVDDHDFGAATAAALVMAGMLSLIVFPIVALALRRERVPRAVLEASDEGEG